MSDPRYTLAYTFGRNTAQSGTPLEESAIVKLSPDSDDYSNFKAGYDSVELDKGEESE